VPCRLRARARGWRRQTTLEQISAGRARLDQNEEPRLLALRARARGRAARAARAPVRLTVSTRSSADRVAVGAAAVFRAPARARPAARAASAATSSPISYYQPRASLSPSRIASTRAFVGS